VLFSVTGSRYFVFFVCMQTRLIRIQGWMDYTQDKRTWSDQWARGHDAEVLVSSRHRDICLSWLKASFATPKWISRAALSGMLSIAMIVPSHSEAIVQCITHSSLSAPVFMHLR
jgi:hypothetical protein